MKKSNRKITSISILFLLSFSFLAIFISVYPEATATNTSPQFTRLASTFTTGGSTIVFSAYNPVPYINNTYIMTFSCSCGLPIPGIISGITDTRGNSWTMINRISGGNNGVGTGTSGNVYVESELWTATQVSTVTTSNVITITLTTNVVYGAAGLFVSNQPLSKVSQGGASNFQVMSNPLGTVPTLNTRLTTNDYTFSGNTQFIIFNYDFSSTKFGTTNFVSSNPTAPLVANNPDSVCNGAQQDIQCGSQQTVVTPNSQTIKEHFFVTITATNNPAITYSYGLLNVVFTTVTIIPPSCQNCPINNGITNSTMSKTLFSITGNTTYIYLADSGRGGTFINNITTLASYTNAGTGKSADFIYLCVYTLSTLEYQKTVSSTNPLTQKACYLNTLVTTGQINQSIIWIANLNVPANVTFGYSIFSRYSGLTVPETFIPITLYSDSSDYVDSRDVGTPPKLLGNAVSTTPLWLTLSGYMLPQTTGITVTFTDTNSTSTTTTLSTSTVVYTTNLYSYRTVSNNQDRVAVFQDVITFFPVWVFPILLSPFGVQGVLVGATIGVILGGILGIMPMWVAFLLTLGLLYVMWNRR